MIPLMNASAVLPPFIGPHPTNAAASSPYVVSASDVVARFGTTLERVAILRGLLSYRQAIIGLGMTEGHMWLDGSFVEDIESVHGRFPNDIDVVTFTIIPGADKLTKNMLARTYPALFLPDEAKKVYRCDAYFVDLSAPPLVIVDRTRYWFGLFSHQRNTNMWKGMLQVALQSDDMTATAMLDLAEHSLGGPGNA